MSINPPKPFRISGGDSLVMVEVYSSTKGTGAGGFGFDDTALQITDVPANLHQMRSGRAMRYGGEKDSTLYDLFIAEAGPDGELLNIDISHRFKIDSLWYTPLGEPTPTGDGRTRVPIQRTKA